MNKENNTLITINDFICNQYLSFVRSKKKKMKTVHTIIILLSSIRIKADNNNNNNWKRNPD